MGKHGQLRRLGDLKKRISQMKTQIKESGSVTSWFKHLPVNMSKDTLIATVQKEIAKNKKFKSSTPQVQAEYLTIAFDTIDKCPDVKINPLRAVELAREIERKLMEHDSSEIKN